MKENIESFINLKKKRDERNAKLLQDEINLATAIKNGYETYADYEFAINSIYARDPRFSLSKNCYQKCQKYLLDTLKAYLLYLRTGDVYNRNNADEGFVLTIYSLNQLSNAIMEKNSTIINALESRNLDSEKFVNQISEPRVTAMKLKVK